MRQQEKALEQDTNVLQLRMSSVQGTGAVKTGNKKEKPCTIKK